MPEAYCNGMTPTSLASTILAGTMSVIKAKLDLEVWIWAERNLTLTSKVTPHPGRVSFRWSPYMIGEWSPLWAYKRYQHMDIIWGAQVGKTFMLQVTLAYDISVDPGPGMIVYPDENTAKRRSKKHLRPLIEDCLADYTTGDQDDLSLTEYDLINCSIVLGWSGSPAVLAAEPIKHLKMDEEAKFKRGSAKEAPPKQLALRRLISFGEFGNSFSCTTPATVDDPGWSDWRGESTKCQHYVPCPHCATAERPFTEDGQRNQGWQIMYFRADIDRKYFELDPNTGKHWTGGIKWDRDEALTRQQRIESAYYECEDCGAHWSDADKNRIVGGGVWVPRNPTAEKFTSHLPSWYSQAVKLRHIVDRWFDAYADEGKRHDFLNSDCAVPYELQGKQADQYELKRLIQPGHHSGTVPPECVVVIATADIHDDHIRYRVRAYEPTHCTSWGIAEGSLPPAMLHLDRLLNTTYTYGEGKIGITVMVVDARWRTDEVYQLCLRHNGIVWPVMGQAKGRELFKFANVYVPADPANDLPLSGSITRIDINDDQWKDRLFNRLAIPRDNPGAMICEEETSDQYFWELTGEKKTKRRKNQRSKEEIVEWIQTHDNHALDCEKYQLVAVDVFQVASLSPVDIETPIPPAAEVRNPYTGELV